MEQYRKPKKKNILWGNEKERRDLPLEEKTTGREKSPSNWTIERDGGEKKTSLISPDEDVKWQNQEASSETKPLS